MTAIKSILIPKKVNKIEKFAFSQCKSLQKFEFEKDSEIFLIDDYSFTNTSLKCLCIPPNVYKIGRNAFSFCNQLKIVEISENS